MTSVDFRVSKSFRTFDLMPESTAAWEWLDDVVVDYQIRNGNVVPVDATLYGNLLEHAPACGLTISIQ